MNKKAGKALAAAVRAYERGDEAGAEKGLRDLIRRYPSMADAHNNYGVLLAGQGRMAPAYNCFNRAAELAPKFLDAAKNAAVAALHLGRTKEAATALEKAVTLAPDQPSLHATLAQTLGDLGDYRGALQSVNHWLRLQPNHAPAHASAGALYVLLGEHEHALTPLRKARALDPQQPGLWRDLAACLERVRFHGFDAEVAAELIACLQADGVEPQDLARATGRALAAKYGLNEAAPARSLNDWHDLGWTDDPLLGCMLARCINVDPHIERVLAAQRRQLLAVLNDTGACPSGWEPLAAHLAAQCFLNEFVWPAEAQEISTARRLLDGVPELSPAQQVQHLLILGQYLALWREPSAPQWEHLPWPEFAAPLVDLVLREPGEEQRIAAGITQSVVDDVVSQAVREQYEESPYPRWVMLGQPVEEPVTQYLQRRYGHDDANSAPLSNNTLVAGCGSGRHALLVARRDPSARVVAIDLSVASLAHAQRKAREHGVNNVEFRHLDILNVAALGERFAVIESFGVLHHMGDPHLGLAALREVLLAGGVMKLALYSAKARWIVNRARARIEALQLGNKPDDVRALRARVFTGLEPSLETLYQSSDFYATSACRDLLFHVQEHQYSAPGIGTLLNAHALELLGFYFANETIPERYKQFNPTDKAMLDLDGWDRFEDQHPATFSNCFQFWCRAVDA